MIIMLGPGPVSVMSIFYLGPNDILQIFTSNSIIDQILFIIIIFTILFVMVTISVYKIYVKNKKLREELDEKSNDLREAFEILSKNHKKLQKVNKDLIQNNTQQKEFINTAAHELRTPTQAITGYIELIDDMFKDLVDEKIETVLRDQGKEKKLLQLTNYQQLVLKNATRLSDLVNDLLDIAKIDLLDDKLRLNKENVDLIEEIKEFKVNYQTSRKKNANNKNSLIIKYGTKLKNNDKLLIDLDKIRFFQILNNLVNNAFKFSNENSEVIISIKEDQDDKDSDGYILISISDQGKGISQSMVPHLFERFATDSRSGTGLGLYITKKLVEAHGGRIWGYNNINGKGSTFEFTLPVSK